MSSVSSPVTLAPTKSSVMSMHEWWGGVWRTVQKLQGWLTELKVTGAYIIDHNNLQHCSLEIQLCACPGYQLNSSPSTYMYLQTSVHKFES